MRHSPELYLHYMATSQWVKKTTQISNVTVAPEGTVWVVSKAFRSIFKAYEWDCLEKNEMKVVSRWKFSHLWPDKIADCHRNIKIIKIFLSHVSPPLSILTIFWVVLNEKGRILIDNKHINNGGCSCATVTSTFFVFYTTDKSYTT